MDDIKIGLIVVGGLLVYLIIQMRAITATLEKHSEILSHLSNRYVEKVQADSMKKLRKLAEEAKRERVP